MNSLIEDLKITKHFIKFFSDIPRDTGKDLDYDTRLRLIKLFDEYAELNYALSDINDDKSILYVLCKIKENIQKKLDDKLMNNFNNPLFGMSDLKKVEYFKEKFTLIPDNQWCEGQLVDRENRKCALGHCEEINKDITGEAMQLRYLFKKYMDNLTVPDVNDIDFFGISHPKYRILYALNLIEGKIKTNEK